MFLLANNGDFDQTDANLSLRWANKSEGMFANVAVIYLQEKKTFVFMRVDGIEKHQLMNLFFASALACVTWVCKFPSVRSFVRVRTSTLPSTLNEVYKL